jgi:hypothetical protein
MSNQDTYHKVEIPSAEVHYNENIAKTCEDSYEFQLEKVTQELTKVTKNKPTVHVLLKAQPSEKLLSELIVKGYVVKYDMFFDSSKDSDKYMTKVRITNPNFGGQTHTFLDNIEDQIRGCAFNHSNINVSEDTKNMIETLLGSFKI